MDDDTKIQMRQYVSDALTHINSLSELFNEELDAGNIEDSEETDEFIELIEQTISNLTELKANISIF